MINNSSIVASTNVNKFDQCINREANLNANTPLVLLNNNSDRVYAAFVNTGDAEVTLILGDANTGGINKGILIYPYGGSFEITTVNCYIGKITAVCSKNAKLSFTECTKG